MSTHCTIGIKLGDSVAASYCHFDGYPQGAGAMLLMYVRTFDQARKMATFGSMDHVKVMDVRTCAPVAMDEWDRWGAKTVLVKDYLHTATKRWSASYIYLFKNNRWYYAHRTDTKFKVLSHKFIQSPIFSWRD
jgi:hypothetical protein